MGFRPTDTSLFRKNDWIHEILPHLGVGLLRKCNNFPLFCEEHI